MDVCGVLCGKRGGALGGRNEESVHDELDVYGVLCEKVLFGKRGGALGARGEESIRDVLGVCGVEQQ